MCGSRKRKLLKQDGSGIRLIIRRLKCTGCGKIHHELPDCVVPYKRYDAGTIESVLRDSGTKLPDYPCESSTAKRLKCWFFLLHDYLEGVLRSLMEQYRYTEISTLAVSLLPLYPVRRQPDGFLKHLVLLITNAGRWVQTRSA